MTNSATIPGRWQFSIRDLMALTTMVALVLTWHRLFGGVYVNTWSYDAFDVPKPKFDVYYYTYYPGRLGLISVALLLWACFLSKYRSNSVGAMSVIVIAWLLTSFNAIKAMFDCYCFISHGIGPAEYQNLFNLILFGSISLPLFATLPAIYFLWGSVNYPAYQKAILHGAVLFGAVDMLVHFYLLSSTFGIYGPYYSPSTDYWITF